MKGVVLPGSAGRTRTYNQLVTLFPKFLKGVDYIIIRSGCEVLRLLGANYSFRIVSEPSHQFLHCELGC